VAGQSIQEQMDDAFDKCLHWTVAAALSVVFLLLELWRWFKPSPPSPLGAAVVCVPLFIYSSYRLLRLVPEVKKMKQGRDGERIVGELLENLRAFGYRVIHDLVGGSFNVDHVVVGPAGVFAIETKTWSKRKGDKIESNGETLWKNGFEIKPNPIEQAKAQARWLHGLINELTNEKVYVQAMVVFPGWWVECKVAEPRTFVLNPDQIEGCLKRLPARIEQKDIGFIANRLELLARTK
jgi:hypothetical protein